MPSSPWLQAKLYGIVDLSYVSEDRLVEVTRGLISGGAGLVQLRAKGREKSEILAWANSLLPLCREASVPFLVNDFIDIAATAGADGVHLGQEDGPLAAARAKLPPDAIVGRSTHSVGQAEAALAEGADYIGFGPLFPTPTKLGRPGIGLGEIAHVQEAVGKHIPVFCIGGIKLSNLPQVTAAGARRVVVVSEWLLSPNLSATGGELLSLLP